MTKSINITSALTGVGEEVNLPSLTAADVVSRGTTRLGGSQEGAETLYSITSSVVPDLRPKLTSRTASNPPSGSNPRGSCHVTLRVDTRIVDVDVDGVVTDYGPASALIGINFPGQVMDATLAQELVDVLYGILTGAGATGTVWGANATRLAQLASELVFAS